MNDKLPPEVAEAIEYLDRFENCPSGWTTIRAYIDRLAEENARLQNIERDYGFAIDCERRRAAQAESRVQELERENGELCDANSILASANDTDFARAQHAEAELAAAQAKIDALMLEYCPNEMTDEQCDAWARRQKVAPLPLDDEAKG